MEYQSQRPAAAKGIFVLVSIVMVVVLPCCDGREFVVGGSEGWVPKPSECYNHWAERNRFQVNDTLYFKYNKGEDSVLVVSRNDYYTCNTTNPIQSLTDDGNSTFKFDHSGPFFFISGIANHCNDGQRLPIVVLAVRPPSVAPTPPPQSPSVAPGQPLPGEGPTGTKGPSTDPSTPSPPTSAAFSSGLGSVRVGVVLVMSIIGYVMVGLI